MTSQDVAEFQAWARGQERQKRRIDGLFNKLQAWSRVVGRRQDVDGHWVMTLECDHEYRDDEIWDDQDPDAPRLFCWRCSVSTTTFRQLIERIEELENKVAALERGQRGLYYTVNEA